MAIPADSGLELQAQKLVGILDSLEDMVKAERRVFVKAECQVFAKLERQVFAKLERRVFANTMVWAREVLHRA